MLILTPYTSSIYTQTPCKAEKFYMKKLEDAV